MLADSFKRKQYAAGRDAALSAIKQAAKRREDWTPEDVQRVIDEAREIIARRNGRDS